MVCDWINGNFLLNNQARKKYFTTAVLFPKVFVDTIKFNNDNKGHKYQEPFILYPNSAVVKLLL